MDLTSKYWQQELKQERLENIEQLQKDALNIESDWHDDLNIAELDCIVDKLNKLLKLAETFQSYEEEKTIQGYLEETQEQKSNLEKRKVSLIKDVFAISSGCVSSLCYSLGLKITDYERLDKIQSDWVTWTDNNFDFYFENWRNSWDSYTQDKNTVISQFIK